MAQSFLTRAGVSLERHTDPMTQLVWDMDGTLVDSTSVVPLAFADALSELGAPPVDTAGVVAAYSLGVPEVILAHLLGRPLADGEAEAYYRRLEDVRVQAYPDVLDALAGLRERGHRVAVFTGAAVRGARSLLGAAGIDVDVLVGGDMIDRPKPAPDGLRLAAQLLHAPIDQVIYIGDAPADVRAAQAAGARAVAAAWGHLYDVSVPADATWTSPLQALDLLPA